MKYSYNWIQKHIEEDLPEIKKLEEVLIYKAFEVEEIIEKDNDYILDIKVLPDRSHDALSHFGMAKEIAGLFSLNLKEKDYQVINKCDKKVGITIEEKTLSNRFIVLPINNIEVVSSPAWLREALESVGQRSINTIVDVTNYILFDLGKPLHVFDADKVKGDLKVRYAKEGERLTTLDGRDIQLDASMLVIADDESVLSIAGIKGGKKAEVDENTKNIIIESAIFNGSSIRKTSQKVGIRTDASKRFENGITSESCLPAISLAAEIIIGLNENAEAGQITDIYIKPEKNYLVGVSASEINSLLGSSLSTEEVIKILNKRPLPNRLIEDVRGQVVNLAYSLVNKPYKRGASVLYDSPEHFDCSSLTAYLYTSVGIQIPRIAIDQYVFGQKIFKDDLLPGDLVFSNTGFISDKTETFYSKVLEKNIKDSAVRFESVEWMPGTKVDGGIDHVGVYVGDGQVVHATSTQGVVVKEKLEDSILNKNTKYIRIIRSDTESRILVTVPFERLDIRLKEDLIDEISKYIGTEDLVPSTNLKDNISRAKIYDGYYLASKIKKTLKDKSLIEIMSTSFSGSGDVAILDSVDPKKNHLRNNLSYNMKVSLQKAFIDAPFIGRDTVLIFEIGKVFNKEGETLNLALGATSRNKKERKNLKSILSEKINAVLDTEVSLSIVNEEVLEDGSIVEEYIVNTSNKMQDFIRIQDCLSEEQYKPISPYPFIVRDISLFIPNIDSYKEFLDIINTSKTSLCVKDYEFDRFKKDSEDRISIGYRLVFQASDKTLTESEIEPIMTSIYEKLNSKEFETR